MERPNLGSTTLAQVAFVVRDIEEAARRWADLLGVDVPNIITTPPGLQVRQTYQGQPSDAQAKLAFFNLGQTQLELIEPIGEDSSWKELLDANGESFHHIAFWVEGMGESARFLSARGIELMHRGDMGEGQFAYFDARQHVGTVIELLENQRVPNDGLS